MDTKVFYEKPAVLTLNRVRRLKRYTRPGTKFRLRAPVMTGAAKQMVYRTLTEEVDQMFPFIVKMKSGRTYTWNEILVAVHKDKTAMMPGRGTW